MTISPFNDARLKVKRAEKHIRDLAGTIDTCLNSSTFRIDANADSLEFQLPEESFSEIPLIIGDALHNMRSSFDIVTCAIERHFTGKISPNTYFPFGDNRKETISKVNRGPIQFTSVDFKTLVIDVIKPYQGGNDLLYILNEIDILDKHRGLVPIFTATELSGVAFTIGSNRFTNISSRVSGSKIRILKGTSPSEIHIENQGKLSFDVTFGETQILKGQAVIPTLLKIKQYVSEGVEAMEKIFLRA